VSQSIAIRRKGNLIAIEDLEDTPDHKGVLKTTYLTPDDAIALFQAGLTIAWATKSEGVTVATAF